MAFRQVFSILVICLIVYSNGARLPGRVVGGKNAEIGQFPYQVSMQVYGQHHCGGSIINEKFILTAGHCVSGISPSWVTVVVGITKLTESGTVYKVKRLIQHDGFSYELENDIALIRVATPIQFNAKVQPIKLPTKPTLPGADLILTGWGSTSYPGSSPNTLQMVHLTAISNDQCRNAKINSLLKIYDTQLCTYTKRGEGACHGDSGGPLVEGDTVVGIVSWGKPCAVGKPDVFTRVESYLDWIAINQHW